MAQRHDAAQSVRPPTADIPSATRARPLPPCTRTGRARCAASTIAARSAWPQWLRRRDREIRERLDRGNEDSLVNFWLYGTSFTKQPRAVDAEVARDARSGNPADVVAARLEDLLAASRTRATASGCCSPATSSRAAACR
jgi:hypothetical protein